MVLQYTEETREECYYCIFVMLDFRPRLISSSRDQVGTVYAYEYVA